MRGWAATMLDLVYPPECAACRAPTAAARGLCPACWAGTAFISGPVCDACGAPVPLAGPEAGARLLCEACARRPPPWARGRAAVLYDGAAREVILRLKHGDRLDLAPVAAGWLARAGAPLLDGADILAPVPLHWRRLLSRRANQAAEVARQLARRGGPAVVPDLLRRTRATRLLRGAGREERARLLAGAIAVAPCHAARVAGARVVVVDDVMTTGATLAACTAALYAGGAARVDVLAIARVAREELAHTYGPDTTDGTTP